MASLTAVMAPVVPPLGEVLVSEKLTPVCERSAEEQAASPWCFTRAQVDVSAFKMRLRQMPPDTWEDYSLKENVRIRRPAHDAWGIKKLIFTFCDDFLQKVPAVPSPSPYPYNLLVPSRDVHVRRIEL
jgi:hypothetical protein